MSYRPVEPVCQPPRGLALTILGFAVLIVASCRTLPSQTEHAALAQDQPFEIVTSDPVLRDVLCRRLSCGRGTELHVEISLRNPSSDVLRNNLLSLATLTMGTFVTHSADVDYNLRRDDVALHGTTHVRDGLWFVLPIYMGFVGTNLGTLLNTYRDPVDLRHYCIEEEPPGGNNEDHRRMCEDYEHFLDAVSLALTPQLASLIAAPASIARESGRRP